MNSYTVYVYPPGWTVVPAPYTGISATEFIYTDSSIVFLGQDKSPVFAVSLSLNPVVSKSS